MQSLHGGQQNRVQGHLQIPLRVSTLPWPIIIVQLLGVGELLFSEGYVGLMLMLTLHTIVVILTCRA